MRRGSAAGRRTQADLTCWRICKRSHAATALSGVGAEQVGGRWNHRGTRMAYASSSMSLAVLELFVHLDPDLAPDDLVAVKVRIPADLPFDEWKTRDLPADWRRIPAPSALADRGTRWLKACEALCLIVPSAVTQTETNVLINPLHADLGRVTFRAEPFSFDPRMWKR